MKILFLCGSLEPGRDGVGDYTRRLSCELINSNHQSTIIALNDRFISESREEIQHDNGCSVLVARFASSVSWEVRISGAKSFLQSFDPDWVSLQFVPFSFHPRGLLLNLPSFLTEIGGERKWHMMFHELWVGMEKETSFKMKAWGWLQQLLIKKLINKIKPVVIHTQSLVYQYQLQKIGFKASILSLFSNIPLLPNSLHIEKQERDFTMIAFGSLYPTSRLMQFAAEVKQFANQNNKKATVKFAGRNGYYLPEWKAAFSKEGIEAITIGELGADKVSYTLQEADLGISTTPFILSQKSGSVSAMLAHGLPVICLGRPWTVQGFTHADVQGVFDYVPGNFQSDFLACKVPAAMNCVSVTSSTLIENFLSKQGIGNN